MHLHKNNFYCSASVPVFLILVQTLKKQKEPPSPPIRLLKEMIAVHLSLLEYIYIKASNHLTQDFTTLK